MSKKIYLKKDSLNAEIPSPNGYKYVGYHGSTFSEQTGANISAIDGSADTLSAVLGVGNLVGDNYIDFTGQAKIVSGKTQSKGKVIKSYYPMSDIYGPIGNTLSFIDERSIINYDPNEGFEDTLKYDQSKYVGLLGGLTPSTVYGAYVVDDFSLGGENLMTMEYGSTGSTYSNDSVDFFKIKMFGEDVFSIILDSNIPAPLIKLKCGTFSNDSDAVTIGGLTTSNIYTDNNGYLRSILP